MTQVNLTTANLELQTAKSIPVDSSLAVYKQESTDSLISPREMTHFVTDRSANFDNGNLVRSSVPVTKGLKTFTNDALPFDFLVSKISLKVGSAATDNDRLTSGYAEVLPASLILGKIKLVQGTEVISITAAELYAGNTEKTKDFFYLKSPILLRKDVPFGIVFEFVGTSASTEAFRIELGGLEYAVASSTIYGKSC